MTSRRMPTAPESEAEDSSCKPPDKVYKLDAQVLAEQWSGLKVKILGTLDPKTDIITVRTIEPGSPSASKRSPPK